MRVSQFSRILSRFKKTPMQDLHKNMSAFEALDPTQLKLMEEECILVDKNDQKTGSTFKKNCHLLKNIDTGMLHRAFSVFLFNSKNELLLQQRSAAKITYPNHWTNTCCSHPLNRQLELIEENAQGVKNAAQRKLNHELGIQAEQVPTCSIDYLTRIHYKSSNVPEDGVFGEHEIDYVLVVKKDVDVKINENEVQAIEYVNQERLKAMLEDKDLLITPWFRLICQNFLTSWWNNLDHLHEKHDHKTIHRF